MSSLSLSLTSLLSRPVFIQGSGVESPGPHSHWRGGRGEASPEGRGRSTFQRGFSSAGSLPRHGASSLVAARGVWTRSLEGLQGFGGTIMVLSDVGSFLLLGPSILTAGRDGHGHLRGQSCPTNSGSSSEDVRCSDHDRDGHDSGNSVVPSSTPGPQADRGPTAGR